MKQIPLLLLSLIMLSLPAGALIRLPAPSPAAPPTPLKRVHSFDRRLAGFTGRLPAAPRFRRPRLNPDDRYNVTAPGNFAFVCSVFSLLCFAALAVTSFPFFVIPAIIFGAAAAVFGAVGFRRHRRGYAIFGLTLGILEIVAGFAVLAMVL